MSVAAVNETGAFARRGKHLEQILNTALRGIPQQAIIDEWASRERPSVSGKLPSSARKVPSVIPEAFFMFPCDAAVDSFEEVVAPLNEMAGTSQRVNDFFNKCRIRALSHFVAESIDMSGPEVTVASILEGLKGDPMTTTALLQAINPASRSHDQHQKQGWGQLHPV